MLQLPAAPAGYQLRLADGSNPDDMRAFAELAHAYHEWLDVDLSFQDFEAEMDSLPGNFAAPRGAIVLAASQQQAGVAVGCVAVRPLLPKHQASESSLHDSPPDEPAAAAGNSSSMQQEGQEDDSLVLDPSTTCEMKRLWVDSSHQGSGLGRVLVAAAADLARQLGYRQMVLDTLEKLTAANRVYEQAGFRRRSRYNHNPLEGVVYWHMQL